MHTLFLDFCSHEKLFALVTEEGVVSTALADHTDEASVLPAMDGLLKEAKSAWSDVSRIAAVTGPGGFMSQRVGLAVANALAWSLKIPIGGLHLSDLYAARSAGDILWLHATKREMLFARGFGVHEKKWPIPMLLPLEELKPVTGSYVGEVLPEQQALLKMKPYEGMKPVKDVLRAVLETVAYGSASLTPWYGRGA